MSLFRDLSGNGNGVFVEPKMSALSTAADVTVPGKTNYLRVNAAGNLIMRPAGSDTDVTVAAAAGEYIPVDPGTIIRSTSTASGIHAVASVE